MSSITAIILTYNEELHIERCISSIENIVNDIVIVDSFSSDNTQEIAIAHPKVRFFQNKWVNYATQFNWALENCQIQSDWIWRIDADEYADTKLSESIKNAILFAQHNITGIYVKRKIVFMGKPLLHGTWYPRWNLKIFRKAAGECENRWMDEHIKLHYGETIQIEGDQIDDNLNNLTWWTEKHNSYATREMVDMLCMEYGLGTKIEVIPKLFGTSEQRLRWLKLKYLQVPFFIRPFINFTYRYVFRFGFLDGKQGLIWHFLQGFWYRFLVDAKIWEIKRQFGSPLNPPQGDLREKIVAFLKEKYGVS